MRRLPAGAQCGLWWLVALQAVLGLLWATPLELPLLPAVEALPQVQQASVAHIQAAPLVMMTPLPVDSGWSWRPRRRVPKSWRRWATRRR